MSTRVTVDASRVTWRPRHTTRIVDAMLIRIQSYGGDSLLLSERAPRHEHDEPAGLLSVKRMLSGRATYHVRGREIGLEGARALALNHGTPYRIAIDAPAESLCVFFAPGVAEAAWRAASAGADALLDAPHDGGAEIALAECPRPADAALDRAMVAMRERALSGARGESLLPPLADVAVAVARTLGAGAAAVRRAPAARASTRLELARRVAIGRELLAGDAARRVSVAEAARAAGLSPFHFLRAFREVYGEPPHRYARRLRLERAAELLARGHSVSDACFATGFESVGSFSALFRRTFGAPPSEWARRRSSARS